MTDAPGDRGSSTRNGTWSEPQKHWLPISRAVFRFAIAHTKGQQSAETRQDDHDLFSFEAFEKFKNRQDNGRDAAIDDGANPLSLHNLRKTLRETAGVRQAEIDLDRGYFSFSYDRPTGGSAIMTVSPWNLAPRRNSGKPVKIDPRIELEALFNKGSSGFALISEEEAKQNAQQYGAARAAASFVWNHLMLRAFDRSVLSGRVKVYVRVQSRLAQFQQLPVDLWSRLKVLNWYDGDACDPEGNRYYSIHAADSLPQVSPPQAEPSSDPGPITTNISGKPGRRKGQGSYEEVDQPLLSKMEQLLRDGKVVSSEAAARMVAPEAGGGGTQESKAERLARRYRKQQKTRSD
jgi:hypothetical protein